MVTEYNCNNYCVCPAIKCSKREQCKYYEGNYWTWNDNSKWAQMEDWSVQGSCTIYNDPNTGKLMIEEEHWCGDLSNDYPYFEKYEYGGRR